MTEDSYSKVPLYKKYTLTIREAAEYFGIGEKKLRSMIRDAPDADYILYNGKREQIKRGLFEQFINDTSSI